MTYEEFYIYYLDWEKEKNYIYDVYFVGGQMVFKTTADVGKAERFLRYYATPMLVYAKAVSPGFFTKLYVEKAEKIISDTSAADWVESHTK